jgi:hypothetical protein
MQNDHHDVSSSSTAVAIVVDTTSSTCPQQRQLRMAVAALIPRKRTHAKDPISMELQHYLFWDDKRVCTHLDSLLTRLAPLSVVHLGSTERRAQVPSSSKNPSAAAVHKAQQVASLLETLAHLVRLALILPLLLTTTTTRIIKRTVS